MYKVNMLIYGIDYYRISLNVDIMEIFCLEIT